MRVRLFVEIDLDDEIIRRGTAMKSPMLLTEKVLEDGVLHIEVPNSLAKVVNSFISQLPAVKEARAIIVPIAMTRDELL